MIAKAVAAARDLLMILPCHGPAFADDAVEGPMKAMLPGRLDCGTEPLKRHREETMSNGMRRLTLGAMLATATAARAAPAAAQTKLKWAHVYETPEPYHVQALWAADEIKKRTNGKYEIQVF